MHIKYLGSFKSVFWSQIYPKPIFDWELEQNLVFYKSSLWLTITALRHVVTCIPFSCSYSLHKSQPCSSGCPWPAQIACCLKPTSQAPPLLWPAAPKIRLCFDTCVLNSRMENLGQEWKHSHSIGGLKLVHSETKKANKWWLVLT